ncbi:MAG: Rrf2 family transcriptional regulator [Desulfobacteraceae bacterium]|jgi:Rrf2 family protein
MRLNRAAEYGVRCVLYMSLKGKDEVVRRRDIAQGMKIPAAFLGKVAQQLARAGIIEILQGAKGGYRLLASPENITLLDVVETFIGEIFLNDCIMNPESCFRSPNCGVNRVWQEARNQLRETLKRATFSALMEESTCARPFDPFGNPKGK